MTSCSGYTHSSWVERRTRRFVSSACVIQLRIRQCYLHGAESPLSESNSHSASQETPRFYATRRFSSVFVTARHWSLSWTRWIQSTTSYRISIRIILSSHLCLGLPSGLFSSGRPTEVVYELLISLMYATCPSHLILLDFINLTTFGEAPSSHHILPLRSNYSSLHPFSDTLNAQYFTNLRGEVTHIYKGRSKIIYLFIYVFIYLFIVF
jgi:hypothetical protein